ncbi:hypothetical protein ACJMK2_014649 [Sinanodonta woodiana]|uniref:LRAT domain-containing protein n=1 Tax=Sinanodonta woodiana TaxID=1069815 RepID=A0ABD3V431_SINWO
MKKILINVYIWDGKLGHSVGHASFSLTDGTYISWWPSSDSYLLSKAIGRTGIYKSLEEDIELQDKRQPDAVFTLTSCVDEDAIHRWWNSFKNGSTYSVFNQNCCWVVFQALVNGSVLQFFPDDKRKYWKSLWVLTPSNLNDFLKDVSRFIQEHEEGKLERFICLIICIALVGLVGLVLSKILTFIIGLFYSLT